MPIAIPIPMPAARAKLPWMGGTDEPGVQNHKRQLRPDSVASSNLDVDLDLDLDVDLDQCVLTPCASSGAFRMFDAGGGRFSAVAAAQQAPVQVQVHIQVQV